MTGLKEILERLSGIHPVREKLDRVAVNLERTQDLLLDHERRLVRLETIEELRGKPGRGRAK